MILSFYKNGPKQRNKRKCYKVTLSSPYLLFVGVNSTILNVQCFFKNKIRTLLIFLFIELWAFQGFSQQTWTSNGAGSTTTINGETHYNWNDPNNWTRSGGATSYPADHGVGDGNIGNGTDEVVNVRHNVYWNLSTSILIRDQGTLSVKGLAGARPKFYLPTGKSLTNEGGFIEVINADWLQEIFIGGDINSFGSGLFTNKSGEVRIIGSKMEIAQDWEGDGGTRYMENTCLLTGQNYSSSTSTDTLIGVCMTIGMQNSGNFQAGSDGSIYFTDVDIEIQDGGQVNFGPVTISGDINTIYINDCDSACSTSDPDRPGNLCASCNGITTAFGTMGGVDLDYYCAAFITDDGNAINGSQTNNCTLAEQPFPCLDCTYQVIDLSLVKDVDNPGANVGDTVTFTLTLSNASNWSMARNVTVTDTVPNGFSYIPSSIMGGDSTSTAGPLSWTIDSLISGTNTVFSFDAEVLAAGDTLNIAQVTAHDEQDIDSAPNNDDGDQSEDDESSAGVSPVALADISLTKTVDNSTANVGDTVTFEVMVINNGPSAATGVIVTDTIPSGFTYVSNDGTADTTGNVVDWPVGNMANGQEDTLHISVIVNVSGEYENPAEVTAVVENDPNSTPNNNVLSENDQDTAVVMPVPVIDLSLDKMVDNSTPNVGDTVTFTLTLSNASNWSMARNVTVTDTIPNGFSYIPSSIMGGDSTSTAGPLSWTIDSLISGTNTVFSFDAEVLAAGDTLNIAQVTAHDEQDIDSAPNNDDGDQSEDDESSAGVSPVALADISLTKTVDNSTANVGDTVTFEVMVINNGPSAATGVIVTDTLPSGFTYVGDDGNGATNESGDVIDWMIGAMALNQMDTLHISASVNVSGDYTNPAEVTASVPSDPNSTPNNNILLENDQDTAGVMPLFIYDLALIKVVADTGPFMAGDTVTYRIHVFNQGTAVVDSIKVRDYIPSSMQLADPNWNADSTFTFITPIPVGGQDSVDIDLRINSGFQGISITNNAEIAEDDGDDKDSTPGDQDGSVPDAQDDDISETNGDDDYDPATIAVTQICDLALVMSRSSGQSPTITAGDTVSFDVRLINQGTLNVDSLVLIDYIDTLQWAPFEATINSGWIGAAPDTAKLNITIGLPLGPTGEITVTIKLISRSDLAGILTNTVEIFADDCDDDDSQTEDTQQNGVSDVTVNNEINNMGSDEDDLDIEQVLSNIYDLALTKKWVNTGIVTAGDTATFRIFIHNQGTITANTVKVKDYIPANLELVDSAWNALDITFIFTGGITSGSVDSVDILLRVDTAFQGTSIINNAEIVEDDGDDTDSTPASEDGSVPDAENDDISETNGDDDYDPEVLIVGQVYDLALQKILSPSQSVSIHPGDTVSFDIRIINQGTVDADSIFLIDYIDTSTWLPFDAGINPGWTSTTPETATFEITSGLPLTPTAEIIEMVRLVCKFTYTGPLTNITEILTDNGDDTDSQTEDIQQNADADTTVDNEINNAGGDEDDEDIATVLSSVYDIALIITPSPGQDTLVVPGDTVMFDITITNQGVEIVDVVNIINYIDTSQWLPFNGSLNLGWVPFSPTSVLNTLSSLTLLPNNSFTASIKLVARPDYLGTLTNTAEIYSDDGDDIDSETEDTQGNIDGDPTTDDITDNSNGDEDDEDIAQVMAQPVDLALIKVVVDTTTQVLPGDTALFRIFVYNQGNLDATNVVVKDYIPSSLELTDPTWNEGDTSFTFASLLGGAIDSVDIALRVSTTFTGTSLINNAEISSADGGNDFDSTPGNNANDPAELANDNEILDSDTNTPQDDDADEDDFDPTELTVTQIFDLALTKIVVQPGPYVPGDTVTYQINIYNQGTLPATDIVVKDYLPDSLTLVDPSWNAVDTSFTFAILAAGAVDSTTIDLLIDPGFEGDSLVNNAEIFSAAGGSDDDSTPGNNANDPAELANDNEIVDSDTGALQDDDTDEDDFDPARITVDRYDLALSKKLQPDALGPFDLFTDIPFELTIFNQGSLPIGEVVLIDYIPTGLSLSPNDTIWTSTSDSTAIYTNTTTIAVGDSMKIGILMRLTPQAYTQLNMSLVNIAEISGMKDTSGIVVNDDDSTPDSTSMNDNGGVPGGSTDDEINDDGTIDEDDQDPAIATVESLDPLGYIYCEKTGDIITGGIISVAGPGTGVFTLDSLGNPRDGSNGQYQFLVDAPGDYFITYIHPEGFPLSTLCVEMTAPFNPSGLDGMAIDKDGVANGELVLGSGENGGTLINDSCSFNAYFLGITIDPTSPPIISNNNIPLSCVLIGSEICDDANSNGIHEPPGEGGFANVDVFLYHCADTLNPIDSALTNALGAFVFGNLPDSCYRLRFDMPAGHFISASVNVDSLTGWSPPLNLAFGECDTTTTICLAPCNVSCTSTGINPVTCIANDGEILVNATGGLGTYVFSLDDVIYQDSGHFTGLAPGSYTIFVRDTSGCTSTCLSPLRKLNHKSCQILQ